MNYFLLKNAQILIEVLEQAMLSNPEHWQSHYHGNQAAQAVARKFSYSDRSRYYWPVADVKAALERMLENLSQRTVPLSLISQYSRNQYKKIRMGEIENEPLAIIKDRILGVIQNYQFEHHEY